MLRIARLPVVIAPRVVSTVRQPAHDGSSCHPRIVCPLTLTPSIHDVRRSIHVVSLRCNISQDMLLSVSMNVTGADTTSQSEMVAQLVKNGTIKTERVKDCMNKVDRKWYARLPATAPAMKEGEKSPSPYAHGPSPIGQCSTISSPYSHGIALEAIQPFIQSDSRILDVGSGSGYITACLAHLIQDGSKQGKGKVLALEHSSVLLEQSMLNLSVDPLSSMLKNIVFFQGDANSSTWLPKDSEPFDVIHAGVAFPSMPLHLVRMLRVGGRMLLPLGPAGSQELVLVERTSDTIGENGEGYTQTKVMSCSYANIASQPPPTDIDSIAPVVRQREELEGKLAKLKDQYKEWETTFASTHSSKKPSLADMRADPVAKGIFDQVAPLRKKKEALDRVIARYEQDQKTTVPSDSSSTSGWVKASLVGLICATAATGTIVADQQDASNSHDNATKGAQVQCEGASEPKQSAPSYPHTLLQLHSDARSIFDAALQAADPRQMMRERLSIEDDSLVVSTTPGKSIRFSLSHFHRIVLIGVGKASVPMSQQASEIFGDRLTEGIVITKHGHAAGASFPSNIQLIEAGHPVPDQPSLDAAIAVDKMLGKSFTDPRTLVLVLISGGGSSLMVEPASGDITLEDIQSTGRALLRSGRPIEMINFLRKHFDDMKGGGLLHKAGDAEVLSLILSDVIGDDLKDIASGPTVPFQHDYIAASHIAERLFNLPSDTHRTTSENEFSRSIFRHLTLHAGLEEFAQEKFAAVPDRQVGHKGRVTNILVGSNRLSLEAAARRATELGYTPCILTDRLSDEARDAAAWMAKVAIPVHEPGLERGQRRPTAFIAGGETVVQLDASSAASGLGGRAQEFALAGALKLHEYEVVHAREDGRLPDHRTVLLGAGTDGTDGPTDATGAVVDGLTVTRAVQVGLDPKQALRKHDSTTFFRRLDRDQPIEVPRSHIITGPTGTNVADVYIAITR